MVTRCSSIVAMEACIVKSDTMHIVAAGTHMASAGYYRLAGLVRDHFLLLMDARRAFG